MKYLLFILLAFFSLSLYAQDSTETVIVHKDPRVDLLVKKQAEANASIKRATSRTAKGFRIMVINTNKRDEAMAAKNKVYTNFPELKAYLIYQSPYFKLKAGNFKTREEAQQYQKYLSAYFPKGVFIINDTIEVTPDTGD
jgi:SPOR domain